MRAMLWGLLVGLALNLIAQTTCVAATGNPIPEWWPLIAWSVFLGMVGFVVTAVAGAPRMPPSPPDAYPASQSRE